MKKYCLLFSIFLMAVGCASTAEKSNPHLVEAAHIWYDQTSVLDIEEAFISEDILYLKYRSYLKESNQSRRFYGKSALNPEGLTSSSHADNIAVPLEFINEKIWQHRPKTFNKVKTLSSLHWQSINEQLIERITPSEPNKGVVILKNYQELLMYYDENESLHVINIEDKPAEVAIAQSLSDEELKNKIIDVIKGYLQNRKSDSKKVLISLPQEGGASNPFLFVDIDNGRTVSLKIEGAANKYQQSAINKGLKSADTLVLDSHVLGVVTRPISSAFRLFNWGKGTTYDVFRPKSLNFLESKEIPPVNADAKPMDLVAFEEKINKMVGNKLSSGSIDFLIDGDAYFPRLIESLLGAEESIHLRTFIFDNDDYGVKIADILKKKSNEGLDVKVLLDGMGVIMGEGKIPENLPAGFVPPKSLVDYLTKNSKVQVRVRPNTWLKADHIKTTVIDDRIGFTGGMNIGREYRYDWHDLMMEVKGPILDQINAEFDISFDHAGKLGDISYVAKIFKGKQKSRREESGIPILPVYTRINDPQIFKVQIEAIRQAKKYIYVHNSYFSDNIILYGLIDARRRGVDVRVILPSNGNHEIMNQSNIVTANIMFNNGIRVFFYPGMSHVKAAVYDGWLNTGSANFDKLSFRDNFEFNLATSDKDTVNRALNELFYLDFKKSREMTEAMQVGLKQRIAEIIAEQL